jgi:hypothetical protein
MRNTLKTVAGKPQRKMSFGRHMYSGRIILK